MHDPQHGLWFQHPCYPLDSQDSLVGVCVVDVVLDPPWLEGEDKWCKHEGAHNVLHKPVLVEAAVTSIVANHKELQGMGVCVLVSVPAISCQ